MSTLKADIQKLETKVTDTKQKFKVDDQALANEKQELEEAEVAIDDAEEAVAPASDFLQISKNRQTPENLQNVLNADKDASSSTNDIRDMIHKLEHELKQLEAQVARQQQENRYYVKKKIATFQREIAHFKSAVDELEERKARASIKSSQLTTDISERTQTLTDTTNDMTDLTRKCEDKAQLFDRRSNKRQQELSALTNAMVEVEKGGNLWGGTKKFAELQTNRAKAPVLLQVRRHNPRSTEAEDARKSLISMIEESTKHAGSSDLVLLAVKMRATSGDEQAWSSRVKKIVSNLLVELNAQQATMQSDETWCQAQSTSREASKSSAAQQIETISLDISNSNASKNEKVKEIAVLTGKIAELQTSRAELVAQRADEKAENAQTRQDSVDGKQAINSAIQILKGFYGTSLLQHRASNQQRQPEEPDTGFRSGEEYHGNLDASTGIIGMLEVIKDDFDNTITQVDADELAAEQSARQMLTDFDSDLTTYGALKEAREGDVATLEASIFENQGKLATEMENKKLAVESLEALQKNERCFSQVKWEERRARLKEEIQVLRQALRTLEAMKEHYLGAPISG